VKILDKYVLREHRGPLLFALAALTSLLLLNYIAKRFGDLVGKGLPWTTIGEFFLLSVPFTVAMTLPMATLVSVHHAFSRLASENEITALKASGVGMPKTLRPVVWAAFCLTLLMLAFNDQVLPRANHRLRVLTSDIGRKKPTVLLKAQVINELQAGKLSLRADKIDQATSVLQNVTIYDLGDPRQRRTIYADSGAMALTPSGTDLEMTLYDGEMQSIPTANPSQLQRLFYKKNRIVVRNVGNSFEKSENDDFKSDREMSICELQKTVVDADREERSASADLETSLANGARLAAGQAGLATLATRPARLRERFSAGALYCRALGVVGVGSAVAANKAAAAPMVAPSGPTGSVSSANARPAAPSTGTPAAWGTEAGASSVGAPPPNVSEALLSGRMNAARTRIEDAHNTANMYATEIQKKFALAVACTVFVFLGAPVALRFPRGGVGLTLGFSLGVFALYYVGLIAGEPLATHGTLSPFVAMWMSNFVFIVIGAFFMARMGKEASTARGGDMAELWESLRNKLRALTLRRRTA
jgi:lipopolysaccharide export system permease protein